MTVYIVNIWVKEGFEGDFEEACLKNHRETRKEPGNLRFDVLLSKEIKGNFTLYEVYRDNAAVAAHKETAHYLEWRKTVEPWMEKKREGHQFDPLIPRDKYQW